MFVHGDFPEDITGGIVCLIPKVNQAKSGSAARPILLLETLQKVLAKILMDRLKPMWPPLSMQVGAVPGGQAIEALFAAHSMLLIAKVTACNHLFIKLDLKGAFDNIKHSSIASFLASLPPTAAWEADRLLRLILQQRLLFNSWMRNGNSTAQEAHCKEALTPLAFLRARWTSTLVRSQLPGKAADFKPLSTHCGYSCMLMTLCCAIVDGSKLVPYCRPFSPR